MTAAKKLRSKNSVKVFKVKEDECIWMKAGVVNFRLCDNGYDCNTCPFDKAMQKAMSQKGGAQKSKKSAAWAEPLRKKYKGDSRPCRHFLTGKIEEPKICTMNYQCYHCPFDQMLYEEDLASLTARPHYYLASGFKIADDYYYHMGHTWAKFEHGGQIRIGFDEFAMKLFGGFRSIELPSLGTLLKQNEVGWEFGNNDNRASVLSPVGGRVLAVNHKVLDQPEISHEDPYHEGWLVIVDPSYPKKNIRGLYYGDEVPGWIEHESQTLLAMIGREYEKLAATGGEIIDNIWENFPEIGWKNLVRTFLKT